MISLTSPVKTRAHGWPAGAKLGALCVSSIALFALPILTVQAAVTVVVLLVYSLPGAGVSALWSKTVKAALAFWSDTIGVACLDRDPSRGGDGGAADVQCRGLGQPCYYDHYSRGDDGCDAQAACHPSLALVFTCAR